jgi:hypothetical protein
MSVQTSHGTQFITDCRTHVIIKIVSHCQSVIDFPNSRSVTVDNNIPNITATRARFGADSQANIGLAHNAIDIVAEMVLTAHNASQCLGQIARVRIGRCALLRCIGDRLIAYHSQQKGC